jgi:hypothetical protein
MLLALGSRICHERSGVEPIGLSKDGPCDVDRIVKGKLFNYFNRGVVTGSKLICESNARCDFDVFCKPSNDLAKSPNLVFRILAGD